jgi:hypothetical protein
VRDVQQSPLRFSLFDGYEEPAVYAWRVIRAGPPNNCPERSRVTPGPLTDIFMLCPDALF